MWRDCHWGAHLPGGSRLIIIMHGEPDEYGRSYNQVVEFFKDPPRSWQEGSMMENTVEGPKLCAASLVEACRGLSGWD